MNGVSQGIEEALKLGQEALAGPGASPANLSIDVAAWLQETLNQWKLKMLATGIGIILLVVLMNLQFFLANLVGLKIPKLLPEMPWWEIMILGMADLLVALIILIEITAPLMIVSIGCTMPVLKWFSC